MPFTIVVSVMEKNMTSDETIVLFKERVIQTVKLGWSPYGEVLFWANAVSQVMISDPIDLETSGPDIEKAQRGGSLNPRELNYYLGGRGHMGEKHWYD